MKVLSLFSGVGGFDLGLEAAGMETVFQCEWDKHAFSILERHWPDVPRWGDISTLTGKHILAHAPVIDVVAWGSPCQDLSVAGKRAGLEGSRSGLFHEGVRIIKELRKETNNEYPRISIWENVYGALNSNRGADFGVILNEMAEAGSLVQEWRVLDAQYFGVPQRRRRVFLISVFDSATAARCPDPLLPVSEGVQWHPSTSNQARQESTGTTPEGTTSRGLRMRSFGDYADDDTASAIKARDYKDATDLVVGKNYARPVGTAVLGSEIIGSLNAVDYKWPQNQQLDENKFIVVDEKPILIDRGAFNQGQNALYKPIISDDPVIPSLVARGPHAVATFTKSKRPQTATDDQTWVADQPNPTLNAFDQGDTRATTVIVDPIVFENSYRDAARIAEDGITQTLTSKMGTGGGNTPMVAQAVNYSFDTQFGSNAEVYEDKTPPLKASQQSPSIVFPIQDGRDIEKHQNGLGVADEGAPSYTIDQTGAQAVAYGLQGNMIGRQDHNGPQGAGISHPNDPMFSLTSTDRHAVAYDEYNDTIGGEVHHALRAGTKQSTGVVIDAAGFKPGASADARTIGYEEGKTPSLEGGGGGNNKPAVLTPTMAVRRLTPLECERLMGWPDGWTATKADGTPQSDTHRYKQCGNGIASPVAQWIAQQLLKLDKERDAPPTTTTT